VYTHGHHRGQNVQYLGERQAQALDGSVFCIPGSKELRKNNLVNFDFAGEL
jgi:hypothetical protein